MFQLSGPRSLILGSLILVPEADFVGAPGAAGQSFLSGHGCKPDRQLAGIQPQPSSLTPTVCTGLQLSNALLPTVLV